MNVFRSALSACVINNLPNTHDYVHKHRDRLMEEKRQKLLAISAQRITEPHNAPPANAGFIGPVVNNFRNNLININNNTDAAVQPQPLPQLQPQPENEQDEEPEVDNTNNNAVGPVQVVVDMQIEVVRDANMQVDDADEDTAVNLTDENRLL